MWRILGPLKYASMGNPVRDRTSDSRPRARNSSQNGAVIRLCQTIASATGRPVVRSHTIVVSRWLVTPMAATSDALAPARLRAARTEPSWLFQIASGSWVTWPGSGNICGNSLPALATGRPVASKTIGRDDVVPWSSARMYRAVIRLR